MVGAGTKSGDYLLIGIYKTRIPLYNVATYAYAKEHGNDLPRQALARFTRAVAVE